MNISNYKDMPGHDLPKTIGLLFLTGLLFLIVNYSDRGIGRGANIISPLLFFSIICASISTISIVMIEKINGFHKQKHNWLVQYVPAISLGFAILSFSLALSSLFLITGGVRNSAFATLLTITPFGLLMQPKKFKKSRSVFDSASLKFVTKNEAQKKINKEKRLRALLLKLLWSPVWAIILICGLGELILHCNLLKMSWLPIYYEDIKLLCSESKDFCQLKDIILQHTKLSESVWHVFAYYFLFLLAAFLTFMEPLKDWINLKSKNTRVKKINACKVGAFKFLSDSQVDYVWKDFNIVDKNFPSEVEGPGISDTWVTAYVISNLCAKDKDFDVILKESAKWLKSKAKKNGGWGYNDRTRSDTDSTCLSVISLIWAGIQVDNATIDFIMSMQQKDNGFATFERNDKYMTSCWSESSQDVTPVAIRALTAFKLKETASFKINTKSALEYLKECGNKGFQTTWWFTSLYSARDALFVLHDDIEYQVFAKQCAKYFVDNFTIPYSDLSDLELALYLEILFLAESSQQWSVLDLIIKRKNDNGSWGPSLALHHTDPMIPVAVVEESKTRDKLEADQNCILTTVTVLRALHTIKIDPEESV